MKKIIAFLLVILCVIPVFAGCRKHESVESAKKKIVGSWTFEEDPDCGEYIVFEDDGDVLYTVGGFKYYGTYDLKKVEIAGEKYIALDSEFSIFDQDSADVTIEFEDDDNTLVVHYVDEDLKFVRKDLPEFKMDPKKITHASADELEATELVIDDAILGSWTLEIVGYAGAYETYTFKKDGTCKWKTDYLPSVGYGSEVDFKYTTKGGKILLTTEMFGGEKFSDMYFEYKMEDGKLVVTNNELEMKYSRVE